MSQSRPGHEPAPIVSLRGINKSFGTVQVLRGVDFQLHSGQVHALLGENGAGKSTLMKILFGVYRADAGEITIDGTRKVAIDDPRDALALGIGMVSQELSLVPQLDVAQNIFLGQTAPLGRIDRRAQREKAAEILRPLAPSIPVDKPVSALGMADQQVVEIARTLARGSRIIAFDEPTSSLTPSEKDGLFNMIRGLRSRGHAIIYISHRLPEIYEIADRVTFLRDGKVHASGAPNDYTQSQMIELITGKPPSEKSARAAKDSSAKVEKLRLANVSTNKLKDISLSVGAGEIFGLAGMVGSGRTEVARAIFGADPKNAGEMFVNGARVDVNTPSQAIAAGIALIPEDRRGQALVLPMDVERNFGLANYGSYTRFGVLLGRKRRDETNTYIDELQVRPKRATASIRNLSGGNQQKVVIARWLKSGASILLFDEPTRGIDVGAKSEIHALMRRLSNSGSAVLMISSELPELLSVCDRIGVMRDGKLVQTVENGPDLTENSLMELISGETH